MKHGFAGHRQLCQAERSMGASAAVCGGVVQHAGEGVVW